MAEAVALAQASPRVRGRSPIWTALLFPFLLLPYRWLWLPCALGATFLVWPPGRRLRDRFKRDGTLIVGSIVVLILRTALDPGYWAPWVLVLVALGWGAKQSQRSRSAAWVAIAAIWVTAFLLLERPAWLSGTAGIIDPKTIVVCAGDSLTSGVEPGTDANTYVARLRERLGCVVVNAGFANDKVGDLKKRLQRDVLSRKPDLVLLFIGGNDALEGTPPRIFAEQLRDVAARIDRSGARLIVVEVPSLWNEYAGLYADVARHNHGILVPETRLRLWFIAELLARNVLSDPLTIDGIHLSRNGAKKVGDWLEPYVRHTLAAR